MNKSENQWELISYLYGEMGEEEKIAFEKTLNQSPQLKEEVNSLKATRSCLQGIEEIKDVPPLVAITETRAHRPDSRYLWWQSPWLQAAVFVMALMCTAALTGMDMRWNSQEGFSLQFGEKEGSPVENSPWNSQAIAELQQAQVQQNQVLQQLLSAQQDSLTQQLKAFNMQMNRRLEGKLASWAAQRQDVSLSDEQFSSIRKELLRENYQLMTDLMEYGAEYQRSYNEQMLSEFAQYLDQQRTEDLQLISVALSDILQQNDIQQQETEILLGQLINHIASD